MPMLVLRFDLTLYCFDLFELIEDIEASLSVLLLEGIRFLSTWLPVVFVLVFQRGELYSENIFIT